MVRATTVVRRAAVRPDKVADTLVLDRAARAAPQGLLTAEGGLALVADLAKPAALEDGDALRLEDGRLVAVRAAPERLLAVRAENPARLLRLAWHLGGHHVPAELAAEVLYVEDNPGNLELARNAGCATTPETRAFRPEREVHHHHHGGHDHHDHGHDDAHGHHDHKRDDHGHEHRGHGHAAHDHS